MEAKLLFDAAESAHFVLYGWVGTPSAIRGEMVFDLLPVDAHLHTLCLIHEFELHESDCREVVSRWSRGQLDEHLLVYVLVVRS
jgi:hypothetical protein